MNWEPFIVCPPGVEPEPTRPIRTREGLGDRLRIAAFAEFQAREAFLWASNSGDRHVITGFPAGDQPAARLPKLEGVSQEMSTAWTALAAAEDRHMEVLLARMAELGIDVAERPVSARLWESFMRCKTAAEFLLFMRGAEERGRQAEERFYQTMKSFDPVTAEIFRKIAEEETAHVALADKFLREDAIQSAK